MVGAAGFEPATLWSQTRCATRLRYAPKHRQARALQGFVAGIKRERVMNVDPLLFRENPVENTVARQYAQLGCTTTGNLQHTQNGPA